MVESHVMTIYPQLNHAIPRRVQRVSNQAIANGRIGIHGVLATSAVVRKSVLEGSLNCQNTWERFAILVILRRLQIAHSIVVARSQTGGFGRIGRLVSALHLVELDTFERPVR